MPPKQIANMSLNGLKRRVATHHKTLIRPWIDEESFEMDLEHWNIARRTPPL